MNTNHHNHNKEKQDYYLQYTFNNIFSKSEQLFKTQHESTTGVNIKGTSGHSKGSSHQSKGGHSKSSAVWTPNPGDDK